MAKSNAKFADSPENRELRLLAEEFRAGARECRSLQVAFVLYPVFRLLQPVAFVLESLGPEDGWPEGSHRLVSPPLTEGERAIRGRLEEAPADHVVDLGHWEAVPRLGVSEVLRIDGPRTEVDH